MELSLLYQHISLPTNLILMLVKFDGTQPVVHLSLPTNLIAILAKFDGTKPVVSAYITSNKFDCNIGKI